MSKFSPKPPPPPPPRIVPPPLPPPVAAPEGKSGWSLYESWLDSSPWLVSFVVHAAAIFLMGLITYSPQPGGSPLQLVAYCAEAEPTPPGADQQPWVVEPDRRDGVATQDARAAAVPMDVPIEAPRPTPTPSESPAAGDARPAVAAASSRETDLRRAVGMAAGGGLEGRGADARPGLAGRRGGSRQSEAAVEKGLRWLAAHQRDDGSWCFDLSKTSCNGLCRNSGEESSTTAATALALLSFLGAGYTHADGEHQETVKRGLYYLGTQARVTSHGVDLRDGSPAAAMYAQAMAALALCETYAMTGDAALKDAAQQAIRFIVFAQDIRGGGWRYSPGEPGDTTVTGWQLMALKSGQLARLDVPSPTAALVRKFLDGVQFEGGARYGYLGPTPRQPTQEATTAVGLLLRMYTGWHRDNPALYRGIDFLHKWGPSENNMYYNYYATQVLHHWGGPEWQAWNRRMRDQLVAAQATGGHEAGSWHFPDPYGDRGGRLYNTALAILTLEVYYRYLPLYDDEAVHDQF